MQEQSYLAGGKESEAFGSEGQARPTLRASKLDVGDPRWEAECDHGECFGGRCIHATAPTPQSPD